MCERTKENEYLIITDKQYLHKVENNNEIKVLQLSNGEKLNLKEIDTQTYWYAMCNSGRFTVVVPDVYTQDLEIAERHLIVDTKEDTTADYEQQFLKDKSYKRGNRTLWLIVVIVGMQFIGPILYFLLGKEDS